MDIKVIDRSAMFPHDAAALVKVTPRGLALVIDALKELKTPGYEIEITGTSPIVGSHDRIIVKLVKEID